ncbi:C-type lectin domain family 17, member A-like [Chiroxiphia lanceolata]|uniref:C-type lectin domain family 17, member A-like n=1 Tax=Chiroxiphia lanceolata TaxID=296741 RepID=UPI0013CEE2CF|nr:C-type lectin domain family 17, member A-like [Chiroxiphia lanceolata]XP_032533233.1 C-type lectin domain family 17, member A-like [Chiroxiphia lanceolata]
MFRGEGAGGSEEKREFLEGMETENPQRGKGPKGGGFLAALPPLSWPPASPILALLLTFSLLLLTVLTCLSLSRASAALGELRESRARNGHGQAWKNLSELQHGLARQFQTLQGRILNVSREVRELQDGISREPERDQELAELSERLRALESRDSLAPLREQLEQLRREQNQILEETRNLSGILCPSCPPGWEQFSRTCYFFSSSTKSWHDSRDSCAQFQAHLAVVDSEQENQFLAIHVPERRQFWLGLTDEPNEGSWHWVTGGALQLQFWNSGEPNDVGHHGEDCAGIYSSGLWNDLPCFGSERWICERPC